MEGQNLELRYDQSKGHLDLSGTHLKSIPTFIFKLPGLKTLDLSNNQISRIPESIFFLPSLIKLDLSKNRIRRIQIKAKDASKIRSLILSDNKINDISGFAERFPELQQLFLAKNKLDVLGDSMFLGMPLLRTLDLSINKLSKLPNSLEKASLLKVLVLQRNQIEQFPTLLTKLRFLEDLDLSNNPLNEWPTGLLGFEFIRKLNLYKTAISELPKSVFTMPRVEVLDIRGLNFDPYHVLESSPSLTKIRTKFAVRAYLNFARKCATKDVDAEFRKILFEIIIEQKESIPDEEGIRDALQKLSSGFVDKARYQQYQKNNAQESIDINFKCTFFLDKSCQVPAYLKNKWRNNLGLDITDIAEQADLVVFGAKGTELMFESNHVSLNKFLRGISADFGISNRKRVYIESLISASSPKFRKMGMDLILGRGLVAEFEDELKKAIKLPDSITHNAMLNLLRNLN